jgi:hypothetical protein
MGLKFFNISFWKNSGIINAPSKRRKSDLNTFQHIVFDLPFKVFVLLNNKLRKQVGRPWSKLSLPSHHNPIERARNKLSLPSRQIMCQRLSRPELVSTGGTLRRSRKRDQDQTDSQKQVKLKSKNISPFTFIFLL